MYFNKLAIYFLFMIAYLAVIVESYRILGVLPSDAESHAIIGISLMKGLAKKGHEVYVISAFQLIEKVKNYYDVPFSFDPIPEDDDSIMGYEMFKSPYVQYLMKSDLKFDVVICESGYTEALFGFSEHFEAPLIALSPLGHTPWNTEMIGSPSPPSYVPFPVTTYSDHMDFETRIRNFIQYLMDYKYLNYQYLPEQAAFYKKYFPHLKRDFYTVRKNVAAILLNTQVSWGYPRPFVPNEIHVGGLHISHQRYPLPGYIEQFVNEAEHGVIYISMGTHRMSKATLDSKIEELFSAFLKLKQRVLWKIDNQDLAGEHFNVFISPWFPQLDVLAHHNVKVFITQCGRLSIAESIYNEKPIIGIPVHTDQFANMAKAEAEGFGISLDYETLNAEDIVEAVEHVIYNNNYTERAKEMSARYKDLPILPLDLAIYWVEHVASQKGANYLHCTGLDLNLIQYLNLDAALILYGSLLTVLWLIFYLFYLLFLC